MCRCGFAIEAPHLKHEQLKSLSEVEPRLNITNEDNDCAKISQRTGQTYRQSLCAKMA